MVLLTPGGPAKRLARPLPLRGPKSSERTWPDFVGLHTVVDEVLPLLFED